MSISSCRNQSISDPTRIFIALLNSTRLTTLKYQKGTCAPFVPEAGDVTRPRQKGKSWRPPSLGTQKLCSVANRVPVPCLAGLAVPRSASAITCAAQCPPRHCMRRLVPLVAPRSVPMLPRFVWTLSNSLVPSAFGALAEEAAWPPTDGCPAGAPHAWRRRPNGRGRASGWDQTVLRENSGAGGEGGWAEGGSRRGDGSRRSCVGRQSARGAKARQLGRHGRGPPTAASGGGGTEAA